MPSVETLIECDQLAYVMHISPSEDNAGITMTLVESVADAKARWAEARVREDWAAADAIAAEWADLIVLLGTAVDGLRAQRRLIREPAIPWSRRPVILSLPSSWL